MSKHSGGSCPRSGSRLHLPDETTNDLLHQEKQEGAMVGFWGYDLQVFLLIRLNTKTQDCHYFHQKFLVPKKAVRQFLPIFPLGIV